MKDLGKTDAAVLAGGLGVRLRAAVSDRPKVLAPVGGKPFLAYLLEYLAAAGISRVVLLTGYMGDAVAREFGREYAGIKLDYSLEPEPMGTGGALALARPLFETKNVLVVNGDSYLRSDPVEFGRRFEEKAAKAGILLCHMPDVSRFGCVRLDNDERIVSFQEKNAAGGPGWINAGLYLLKRELLDDIPMGNVSIEREVFPKLTGQGLYGFKAAGEFIDIGTPESYGAAENFFKAVG